MRNAEYKVAPIKPNMFLAILSKGQLNIKVNILSDKNNYMKLLVPLAEVDNKHFYETCFILTEEYIIINIPFKQIYKSKQQ